MASTAESLCKSRRSKYFQTFGKSSATQSSMRRSGTWSSEALQARATSRCVFRSRKVKVSRTTGTDVQTRYPSFLISRHMPTARAWCESRLTARAIHAPLSTNTARSRLIPGVRRYCHARWNPREQGHPIWQPAQPARHAAIRAELPPGSGQRRCALISWRFAADGRIPRPENKLVA